jgi:hypothetical protein
MKTVIEMAEKAGFEYSGKELTWESVICTEELNRFAELVRAEEREACAELCVKLAVGNGFAADCAAAIRARGQHGNG